MPIMNGEEAFIRIKKDNSSLNNETTIVASTGNSDDHLMDDYIVKPISRNLLYEKLKKWLSKEEIVWITEKWRKNNKKE